MKLIECMALFIYVTFAHNFNRQIHSTHDDHLLNQCMAQNCSESNDYTTNVNTCL